MSYSLKNYQEDFLVMVSGDSMRDDLISSEKRVGVRRYYFEKNFKKYGGREIVLIHHFRLKILVEDNM